MSYLRMAAIGAASLLVVSACSKNDEAVEQLVVETNNTLFDYVPTDTPYLAGNLEPIPDEVIDVFLQRVEPILDSIQLELTNARKSLETESTEDVSEAQGHDEGEKLLLAILQEFDGKLNRSGMESLGFDLRANKVLYGVGVFPVLRLGLSDAGALRATIQRILANADIDAPELEYQGISYWRAVEDEQVDGHAGVYIAILSDHLAVSLLPAMAENELLPAFLGLEIPQDSNAAQRLTQLNTQHGYTPYGSGILNLESLLDEFINPDPIMTQLMMSGGEYDPASMTDECRSEIQGMVSNTPRMTMGISELTTQAVAMQYRVETKPTLAQQLIALVAEIPAANPVSKRILELSFGMKLGAARDFLRKKAAAIMEEPYVCEHLQSLNESATEAFTQLNQPLPPFVNNFRGVRMSLEDLEMVQNLPANARGLIAVHVDQPEMFVGMAQMFVPDLSELQLVVGDPPVQLPSTLIPVPDIVAFAAISEDAIGLSVGEGEESKLPSFLDQEANSDGIFLSANYDMAAYIEYTQNMTNQYDAAVAMDSDQDAADSQVHESINDISKKANEALKSFVDRENVSLRLTSEGLVVDSKMTFK